MNRRHRFALLALATLLNLLMAFFVSADEEGPRHLKPFPVPEWLTTTHQRLLFDVYPSEHFQKQGVKITCAGTNFSPFMYVWDGSKIVHINTGEEIDYAHFRKIQQRADELDMKIFCPLARMWHPILLDEHPEWQELYSPDARPKGRRNVREPWNGINGCWMSPFGDFFIQQSVEIGKRVGFHGYNLDGFGTFALCYCRYCKKAYREDASAELPPRKDIKDLGYRKFMRWKLDRWTDFVWRWQKAIKDVNPDFAAVPWSTGPGRWMHWTFAGIAECSVAANRLIDCPILELFWDFAPDQGSNLLPSFVIRYYRGLSAERPVMMLPYFSVHAQMRPWAPQAERDFRVLSTLANGALCSIGNWMVNPQTPPSYYMDMIAAREPYTQGAKTVKWAAMLVSENSRLFYGVPEVGSELGGAWIGSGVDTPDISKLPASVRRLPAHVESALGVFRAMTEEQLPMDFITAQDIDEEERLNLYKILILPNVACLSDLQAQKIRRFVERGGGLVALHESSLYDEYGSRRDDFALADVFGASFKRVRDHMGFLPHYRNFVIAALLPHEITDDESIEQDFRMDRGEDRPEVLGRTMSYVGLMSEVSSKADATTAAFISSIGDPGGINSQGLDRDALGKVFETGQAPEAQAPLLLTRRHGKGRVVYLAGDLGQSYFVTPFPAQRKLLTNSARWVARDRQPTVEIDAPLCVLSNVFEQKAENRTVVHLLNQFNSAAGRSLPAGSPSAREEVVPLHGIRVTFRGASVRAVRLEPEGLPLEIQRSSSGAAVVVPELRVHSMVVAQH